MANLSDQKVTVKEVCYIVSAIAGLLLQHYSLKLEIRDSKQYSVTEMRIVNLRLDALEKQDDIHDQTLKLVAGTMGEMIEANAPQIRKRKK